MESRPQNHEFRNNPENFHPCDHLLHVRRIFYVLCTKTYYPTAMSQIRETYFPSLPIA